MPNRFGHHAGTLRSVRLPSVGHIPSRERQARQCGGDVQVWQEATLTRLCFTSREPCRCALLSLRCLQLCVYICGGFCGMACGLKTKSADCLLPYVTRLRFKRSATLGLWLPTHTTRQRSGGVVERADFATPRTSGAPPHRHCRRFHVPRSSCHVLRPARRLCQRWPPRRRAKRSTRDATTASTPCLVWYGCACGRCGCCGWQPGPRGRVVVGTGGACLRRLWRLRA